MVKESPNYQELGYEEVMAQLEEVVRRLEAGNLPLEESIRVFERGISLARMGEARLNEAEKRVEQLLAGPTGEQVVAFEPEGKTSSGSNQEGGKSVSTDRGR